MNSYDFTISLALFRCRPRGRALFRLLSEKNGTVPFARGLLVLLAWLAVGLPAALAMGSYTEATLSDAGEILGDGKITLLEPEKWIGKRFPLLAYIDVGDRLKEGKWLVVLYRNDCPECQAAIPRYRQLSRDLAIRGEATRVALIEIPPYGSDRRETTVPDGRYVLGRLGNTSRWVVRTPQEIVLANSVVTKIGE